MADTGASPQTAPGFDSQPDDDGGLTLVLSGDWTLRGLARNTGRLVRELQPFVRDERVHWDLRSITALDSVGALVLWQACDGARPAHVELRPEHAPLFRRWSERSPQDSQVPVRDVSLTDRLARFGRSGISHVTDLLALTGQVILDTLALVRRPWQLPLKDLSATIYQAGVKALGITALVGFLIGVVLSYLSSLQLRAFGAEVFIVNILGLAIIRELGPLLAAILVAGRSGSAMAAQLGMMRLTEELDALTVMGIPHSIRLVLPKLMALAIALPLLVLWTDVMALIGGMLSAKAALGISTSRFIEMLPNVVPIANLWIGLAKAVVFGLLIAMIACHFGLRIKPNTESLGLETTNAVVTSITLVILADAIFAIVFRSIGVAS